MKINIFFCLIIAAAAQLPIHAGRGSKKAESLKGSSFIRNMGLAKNPYTFTFGLGNLNKTQSNLIFDAFKNLSSSQVTQKKQIINLGPLTEILLDNGGECFITPSLINNCFQTYTDQQLQDAIQGNESRLKNLNSMKQILANDKVTAQLAESKDLVASSNKSSLIDPNEEPIEMVGSVENSHLLLTLLIEKSQEEQKNIPLQKQNNLLMEKNDTLSKQLKEQSNLLKNNADILSKQLTYTRIAAGIFGMYTTYHLGFSYIKPVFSKMISAASSRYFAKK